MTGQTLHMLHLPLIGRRVTGFAHAYGLSDDLASGDGGYAVHALLAALFGNAAPGPFFLQPRRDQPGAVDLLAYSRQPLAALEPMADLTAPPQAHAAIQWADAADKMMPTSLPAGMTLGFQVRVCPVVRLARGTQDKTPGAEVDAFLAALDQHKRQPESVAPERNSVYRDWLTARLPGGQVLDLQLDGFRHATLSRRSAPAGDSPRPLKTFRKPDALYRGRLRITDGALLLETLTRGVGRHRAFGFGMLLLRPDPTPAQ